MAGYVIPIEEIERGQTALVGGKGAHLGVLSRMPGISVPAGFCVTTNGFQRLLTESPAVAEPIGRLSRVAATDLEGIRTLSVEIRRTIENIPLPDDLAAAITRQLARRGEGAAWAVRSSATAEDMPTASFAGQHDTYLNVVGGEAVLRHVSRCWGSLFTERAVAYRLRNGMDNGAVLMAVVVQEMVRADAAGLLFTADPVSGNRRVASVEAVLGLGEPLVSGRTSADVYAVREGAIVARTIAAKSMAMNAAPAGGTRVDAVESDRQKLPALSDAQVLRLVDLGQRIEAHLGAPQDIEWCLAEGEFHIVQSRPITTLFPIPAAQDGGRHVYVSVGHQQMMTDAMKPLGISVWQLTALRPMYEAGGRLFVDVTRELATAAIRPGFLEMVGRSDPLIGDALQTILDRGDFVEPLPDPPAAGPPQAGALPPVETDSSVVHGLIARTQDSIAGLRREIRSKSGPELLEFILSDIQELKRLLLDRQSHQAIMAGMEATWWLNEKMESWLGEKNAADALAQSAPHNVTSEMGLALLDVADAIRPHPEVVSFLEDGAGDDFLDRLSGLAGGPQARDAIVGWLDRYGMRCPGEIDITRPRWSERPRALVPLILGNIRHFEPGAAARRFEQGLQEAHRKRDELLDRLRVLPDGEAKAEEAARMIDRLRTFIGYREYPKYGIISRYLIYKQALMAEADRLVHAGALRGREDIFYLTFQEIQDLVRTGRLDDPLIRERRYAFLSYQALTPPRVITSDGEVVSGGYRRGDFPAGALMGLAVSGGIVEGRARVLLDMAAADLEPGDILVTIYTDPSWTPLFLGISGLVTEVGGLMTHGAVIAREYGLPAVVGVERATGVIRDGQRIRVNGTEGFVEILPDRV
jgi:rifampicin phosphotransferase